MSAAKNTTAEIVALGEARAQRDGVAPMLDTAGAMLRAAREDAGLGVTEVADEINVKPERLAAIEAMDLEALPAAPYALGFVRAYAGFLGLPVEPLVARFREEAGWAKPVTAPKIAAPKSLPREREVGLVGILMVLGFVVWAVWQIVGRSPAEEEAALPSGFPIADRTEEVQVVPEVTTSLEDDLTLTPPVVVGDAPGGQTVAPSNDDAASANREPVSAEQTDDARHFALVPTVLTRPLGAPPAPAPRPAPTAQPAAPATPAEALNEQFLEEVLADSGRDRRTATAPSGPVTGRAAPTPAETAAPTAPTQLTETRPARVERVERVAAQLTDPVSPVYPRRCQRRADEEEVVTVAFSVSRFGRVTGPSVAQTTNSCFDDAALAAVSRFGFTPATEGGRAVREAGRTSRIVFRKP